MEKPIVSFITFNKAGIVARNLEALLATSEDFDLYIVDNGSTDDTWRYVETLQDKRIVCKKRFDANHGCVYGLNYVISHRKPGQYFVHFDSDVCMHTDKWFEMFLNTFRLFPELGLIGGSTHPDLQGGEEKYALTTREGVSVYKLAILTGCSICIRPEVLDMLGYFSEEICGADMDMCRRIHSYTPYENAILPSLEIDQKQWITCEECTMRHLCRYNKNAECIHECMRKYAHRDFYKEMILPKSVKYYTQIEMGERTPYCASIHDQASMQKHQYDQQSAIENFNFFIRRGN